MLHGLELYLGMSALPPTQSFDDYYPEVVENPSSDGAELCSLLEENDSRMPPQVTPNSLMMLLSGKQKSKKDSKRVKESPESVVDREFSDNSTLSSFTDGERGDIASAFLPDKSIRNTLQQDDIMALERRIYSSAQTVSASHFLQGSRPELEPELAIVGEYRKPIELLENKSVRAVTARDLFLSFSPKSVRNKKGEWTLKVRLKISPSKLATIKRQERVITTGSKPSLQVTLKLPIEALRNIQKSSNPLFVRRSGNPKSNGVSAFDIMMKTATKNTLPKLTEIQKLNGLEPPSIKREQMHVVPDGEIHLVHPPSIDLKLHESKVWSPNLIKAEMDDFISPSWCHSHLSPNHNLSSRSVQDISIQEYITSHAPLALVSKPHKRIYEDFILKKSELVSHLPWPQKFEPPNLDCLLVNEPSIDFLKSWINDSFSKLEKQSLRKPRNVRKREQLRRQKRKQGPMADFIVNEDELEDEETDEDIYSPILIILGEHGSCKTSAVHAAMKALKGYVHEINSGQQRSRKDLHTSLKEFCTTNIISKSSGEDQFQKGLVLFEDCDVLFEQDKTFWTVVQDIVNYSRRPIVLTARESSVIPRSIWDVAREQDSIRTLMVNDRNALSQYLWLCCFAHGCILSKRALSDLLDCNVTSTGFDVRKLLMACQLLCSGRRPVDGSFNEIDKRVDQILEDSLPNDICDITQKLDALSVSDVLDENTPSAFRHELIPNELLDLYIIDHSHLLKQNMLPYELSVGLAISKMTNLDHAKYDIKHDFNSIRLIIIDFLSSRAKALPKFLQDMYHFRTQTRSRSAGEMVYEEPETQGLPDTSTCYSMSKQAFLIDLAPIVRDWALFQKSLIHLDSQRPNDAKGQTLQEYLNWRLFHGDTEEVLRTI